MRIRAPLFCSCLVAAGCLGDVPAEERAPETASESHAILGGTISEDDHGVGMLLARTHSCTATLISPYVMLTAAHCVDGHDDAAIPESVFFGVDVDGSGVTVDVTGFEYHPDWTFEVAEGHDVALVLLERSMGVDDTVPLNSSPASDHVGEDLRLVGYGVSDRDTFGGVGIRRTATELLRRLQLDMLITGSTETGICSGDSGGPALLTIDGTERVAGVISWGTGETCYPPMGCARVDLYLESFIRPWVQANDPTCKEDGLCVRELCVDDPDCEPCGPEGTCTSQCPLPDPDCPTSDLGEICQADTQCVSGLCVFWRGDVHTKFCSRACNIAADDCPGDMTCQNVVPFGDICYYEDDPPGVVGDRCDEPTDCGSYLCDDGECVIRCDIGAGKLCPVEFECSSSNGVDYFCHSLGGDGGGCSLASTARSTSGPTTGSIALLLLALCGLAVLRRQRSD